MRTLLRTVSLVIFVVTAYGAGRTNTPEAAPCRAGLL